MIQLRESTNYVIGIWSLRAVVFECISIKDAHHIQRIYNTEVGITPHCALCLYTRDEWLNGFGG